MSFSRIHAPIAARVTIALSLTLCFAACTEGDGGSDGAIRDVPSARSDSGVPANVDSGMAMDAAVSDASASDGSADAFDPPCICGDGMMGDFDPPSDTVIQGGTYQYRSFRIRAGVTVRAEGAMPLSIFSRGPVEIAGTLELNGRNGLAGLCELSNMQQPGGVAGAGGSTGGAGGARRTAALPGMGEFGGRGAAFTLPGGADGDSAGGGGGGGGNAAAGANGANGECCPARCPWGLIAGEGAGGPGGMLNVDMRFVGGGGGGGGAYGRADNGNGGSGGGGGGAVRITAPAITVSGGIFANGGAGASAGQQTVGGAAAECDGGAGGGGAGGFVWLRAGQVTLEGTLSVRGGVGGRTVIGMTCGVGGAGGSGADGIIRLEANRVTGMVPASVTRGSFSCASVAECR